MDYEALDGFIESNTAQANAVILLGGEDGLVETAGMGMAVLMMGRGEYGGGAAPISGSCGGEGKNISYG